MTTSTTPLPKKLGLKAGQRVAFVGPPDGFLAALQPDLARADLVEPDGADSLDLVVLFARSQAEVEAHFDALAERLDPAGGLWVAWPKKASGVASDLSDDVVQRLGLDRGLVDNKICSVDATWSAMRFVRRLVDRPGARRKRS